MFRQMPAIWFTLSHTKAPNQLLHTHARAHTHTRVCVIINQRPLYDALRLRCIGINKESVSEVDLFNFQLYDDDLDLMFD